MPDPRFANGDAPSPEEKLRDQVRRNALLDEILCRGDEIALPDWYLCAGCIAQTVWNIVFGRPPHTDIKDIDLIYFDPADLSRAQEACHEDRIRTLFSDCPIRFDVKNQARVHMWYRQAFGYDIAPYRSSVEAIATFPTTATCVGLRTDARRVRVVAPYGLRDLLGGIIRPNKRQVTAEIYAAKVERWRRHWPDLVFLPW